MKKIITIVGLMLLGFSVPPEKKYKFEFNDAQLNVLWNCIDNSNAPHAQVKEIQSLIQAQIKSQIPSDTTKKK